MRLHVVSLPKAYTPDDAYLGKTTRFTKMMRDRGHDVILYGNSESDVVCYSGDESELIFDPESPRWRQMNQKVIESAAIRKTGKDILCIVAGRCQQEIVEALPDFLACEPFVGYGGVSTNFRAFESEAWRHTVYGASVSDAHAVDGVFYDTVIPNYYDKDEFPRSLLQENYLLFVGRLIDRKGIHIAATVAEVAGVPLILAGAGEWNGYGTHVGVVDHEHRARLMGGAIALLAPTTYIEPFGGVAAEAQLCGTPVLSTPWGAFSETVLEGVTGYHCHILRDWLANLELCEKLNRDEIQWSAQSRFSYEAVTPQFETWFERLETLWGDGWYSK